MSANLRRIPLQLIHEFFTLIKPERPAEYFSVATPAVEPWIKTMMLTEDLRNIARSM
nr:hypothetical protein [Klebsiella pneumoniae subsp. pneumoniae]